MKAFWLTMDGAQDWVRLSDVIWQGMVFGRVQTAN